MTPLFPMKKYLLLTIFLLFIVQVQAVSDEINFTANEVTIKSYGLNSTINFSFTTTADYLLVTSNNIYFGNLTDSTGQICDYNFTEQNSYIDISEISCIGVVNTGAPAKPPEFTEADRQAASKNTLIKAILWIILSIIMLICIFILDIFRRDKKLRPFAMIVLALIIALSLAIIGLIIQNFLLYDSLQFSIGIMILMWLLAFFILVIVAYILDVKRRTDKVNPMIELIAILLTMVALFMGGWIIQNTLLGYNMSIKLTISIVGAIAVFLIIIAFVVDKTRKR